MNKLVSIIVPIYNGEKYLEDCVSSILASSYSNIEIVLVNDGSTDRTKTICEQYLLQDARIKYLETENYGVTHARKEGVRNSLGEYICFVDADDSIRPYYIENLYKAVKIKNALLACVAVEDGIISTSTWVKGLLLCRMEWRMSYKLYHRSLLLDALNTPRTINVGEDLIANLNVAQNESLKDIHLVNTDGYIFRENMDSVTHQRKFSLAYEEGFMREVQQALRGWNETFAREWWLFRMNCWKNLVLNDVRVSRKLFWVDELLREYRGEKVGISYWVLLNVPQDRIVRFLLKSLKVARKFLGRGS